MNWDSDSESALVIQDEKDISTFQPAHGLMDVEKSKAIQEVQAAFVIAKRFPRDETKAFARIMKSCARLKLAEQALYRLPIGGKNHEGPSIRLAEVLAQAWGNLRFGIKELDREQGRSVCIAYCLDLETNTTVELDFTVDHWIEVGTKGNKTKKIISDPVEIDRLIANRGARKLRNCILNVIPPDVVDEAVKSCRKTVAGGGGEPLTDRIRRMVTVFAEMSITVEMLEERLGHEIDITTGEEIVELTAIYRSLVDKQAKRSDFFRTGEVSTEKQTSSLADKLRGETGEPKAEN